MGLLNWFDRCSQDELETAKKLIAFSNISAKSSFIPLLKRMPSLEIIARDNRLEKFDYYYICACGLLLMQSSNKRSELVALKKELESRCKGSYKDVVDLANKVNGQDVSELRKMDVNIGSWVLQKTSAGLNQAQVDGLVNDYSALLGKYIIAQVQNFL